jgi:type II pantothenate kinase
MIAALDWGGSWADAILWDGGALRGSFSTPSRSTTAEDLLHGLLEKIGISKNQLEHIALSGGDVRRVGSDLSGILVRPVDELESIAAGARHLSGRDEAVAVSCGTGTAVVYYVEDGGLQTLHLGGTAVGGGTLEGLGQLLLKIPVEELEMLAQEGKGLDLTVGDIVGTGIGVVPADATASHFAKAFDDALPADVAKSLLHLVAETIATVASLAADKTGCNDLVFTGRVAQNKLIQQRIAFACQIHGKTPHFPSNGEYATAIGAAIRSQENMNQ